MYKNFERRKYQTTIKTVLYVPEIPQELLYFIGIKQFLRLCSFLVCLPFFNKNTVYCNSHDVFPFICTSFFLEFISFLCIFFTFLFLSCLVNIRYKCISWIFSSLFLRSIHFRFLYYYTAALLCCVHT